VEYEKGEKVLITEGIHKGLKGIIQSIDKELRVELAKSNSIVKVQKIHVQKMALRSRQNSREISIEKELKITFRKDEGKLQNAQKMLQSDYDD